VVLWWQCAWPGCPAGRSICGAPGNRDDWAAWPGHYGRVDLDAFVRDGYVAVHGAVDAGTVAACRELIWAAMERRGVRRDDPGSWPALVEGMDDLTGGPLLAAYLTAAYDELIGPGRWQRSVRPVDIGETVVVRFPAEDERANAGYHIEGSYAPPGGGPGAGWVNIRSRAPRAAGAVPVHRCRPPRRAHPAAVRLAPGRPAVPGALRGDGHRLRRRVLAAVDPVHDGGARHREGRGRVLVPSVHGAYGDLAAPGRRAPDDRAARGQCPRRLRAGRLRSLAGGPGDRQGPGDGGLRLARIGVAAACDDFWWPAQRAGLITVGLPG
jgi:hypothetical protein